MARLKALVACAFLSGLTSMPARASEAGRILEASGVRGGLVVHLGCGTGELTAALRAGDGYLVHGLDADAAKVAAARRRIEGLGLYGPVSVDTFDGQRLPYVDGLVNLIVSEDPTTVPRAEIMRCLAPLGVAMIDGRKTVKPWPDSIDEWTHYLHGPDNNAVANDTVVGPPRHYQWQGGARWARHHDHMASMSALVTSRGRLFYVFDEGSTASLLLPSKWALIARDAFSGVVLWKRRIDSWYKRTYRLKGGPADAPRRLVASRDEVYVPLGLDAPLSAIDAVTGEVLRTYEGTRATEEVLLSDGVLFLIVNPDFRAPANLNAERPGGERKLMAFDAASGRKLWEHTDVIAAMTPAVDGGGVYYFNRTNIISLDRRTGRERWRSAPLPTPKRFTYFFAMSLVVKDGVVLLASGEQSGVTRSGGGCTKSDSLAALSAETGEVLWRAEHGPSGYSSPEDLFVIDGVAWSSAVSNGVLPGTVTGHDLRTGKVRSRFDEDVKTYWFHHRCYPGKATVKYLMPARTGTEFIDIRNERWDINHFSRGGCIYGVMPANGFLYTPMHACACYSESKLFGMNALAAASPSRTVPRDVPSEGRLERGPAYGSAAEGASAEADWPTYRHDSSRSGATKAAVPATLREAWRKELGGKLTSMTSAQGKLFIADPDRHAVKALDAATGDVVWSRTVGGRVDSPPTWHGGRVIFGCADGRVYSLRASDGEVAWRFRAAPVDRRMTAFGQVESLWPVSGSVLVHDGIVHCVAGRSMFMDGGLRYLMIDAATGRLVAEGILDHRNPKTGGNLQELTKWLNMPVALPDVLSTDGKRVYMRSQAFDMNGKRLAMGPLTADSNREGSTHDPETSHLFCPTGFLDGTWFHRSYWMYGSRFSSGWKGYYVAGKNVPAGRIMAMGESRVYGFGREPKYYRWTTPLEYRLFASARAPVAPGGGGATGGPGTRVSIENSKSLDPAGKGFVVEAWVKPDRPDGVVLARGGAIQGYALALKKGVPEFHVRLDKKLHSVRARGKARREARGVGRRRARGFAEGGGPPHEEPARRDADRRRHGVARGLLRRGERLRRSHRRGAHLPWPRGPRGDARARLRPREAGGGEREARPSLHVRQRPRYGLLEGAQQRRHRRHAR
ncbi:MAG: outer membrane protein assembly factor BamB family protein [Planctomycetota bacterium]|jgi:outer membrane protein assembly factor BamB